MADEREVYHREIHEAEGPLTHRVTDVIKKNGLPYTLSSLENTYRRWRDSIVINKEVKQSTASIGALDKLKINLTAFDDIVDELLPNNNPLDLPLSQENNYHAFKLPVSHNDILLLNDIHVPYHNITALTAALKYGMEHEVNTVLLNADSIDFYAISRLEKDPRKRNFGHEVLMTRQILETRRKLFPNSAR